MPANLTRIGPPFGDIDYLAVFACRTNDGTHAGIVYRGPTGGLRLLHQAFHLDLRDDDFLQRRGRFVCVIPNLLREELVALAGYCRLVYARNAAGGIPYNLEMELDAGLDAATGDLIMPGTATGMSCSTFVVHVFRSTGNDILDVTDWPKALERLGDTERQQQLLAVLESNAKPGWLEHAKKIRPQLGCPRIRPEEVAGACLEDLLPANFSQCDPNGKLILAVIDCRCGQYL